MPPIRRTPYNPATEWNAMRQNHVESMAQVGFFGKIFNNGSLCAYQYFFYLR